MTNIYLVCPMCAYRWLAAMLRPGDGSSPEAIATQCYCPKCQHHPPMRVVREDQPELFT